MIFFSYLYRENKSILYNYWLKRYFNFEEIIIPIRKMVVELLKYNSLIDRNEAIRIVKRDNTESLKSFSHGFIKRYSLNE